MYIVKSKVVIEQVTQITGQVRNKTLEFDFTTEFSCSDSWRDFTNNGTLKLPKNLKLRNEYGKVINIFRDNIGGLTSTPLIMRGDKITIDYWYQYYNGTKWITEGTDDFAEEHLFNGYISEVGSKMPIEIKFEDNFWILKQTPCQIQTFKATDTVKYMLETILKPYNDKYPNNQFKVVDMTDSTIGEFRVGNETVSECLARLRKTYHFESYFRGNNLYIGLIVYDPTLARERTFTFQKNIISDELQYKRKDDITLSIVASNKVEIEAGGTTKDGKTKTKQERIEVLVTLENGSDTPIVKKKEKNVDFPPNTGGERMTMQYPFANNYNELIDLATKEIKKYYYSGFKGKFTTFGIPVCRTGDNIRIIDTIQPERNGLYKCKSVEFQGGKNGIRQTIQLDYKIQ